MQTLFDVLVDPHRREILAELRRHPQSTGALAAHLGLSQPGTSKHLRRLRETGFVTVRPSAQQRIYSLAPVPFDELDAWLQDYRQEVAQNTDTPPSRGDALGASDSAPLLSGVSGDQKSPKPKSTKGKAVRNPKEAKRRKKAKS